MLEDDLSGQETSEQESEKGIQERIDYEKQVDEKRLRALRALSEGLRKMPFADPGHVLLHLPLPGEEKYMISRAALPQKEKVYNK